MLLSLTDKVSVSQLQGNDNIEATLDTKVATDTVVINR